MNLIIKKNKIREQMPYEVFAFFINTVMIIDFLRLLVGNSGVIGIVRNGVYIITAMYVCYHAYTNKHMNVPMTIVFFYLILSTFSLLQNTRLFETIMDGSMIFLFRCVPGFYLACYLPINSLFFKKLNKYYIILFLYCATYMSTHTSGIYAIDGSYMTFSYNILIMTAILILKGIQKPTVPTVLGSAVLVGIVVSYGARGPILCLAISVLLFLWYRITISSVLKKIVISIFCISGVSFLFMLRNIIIDLLLKLNPLSRTLYMLKNFDLNNLGGRNTFYDSLITEIDKNWILPHGLYADRIFVGGNSVLDADLSKYYAHNFLLEIMIQFGAVIGVLILFYLLFQTIKSYKTLTKYSDYKCVIIFCAFFTAITTLFFSSSYLINERVWLALGIIFSLKRIKIGEVTK